MLLLTDSDIQTILEALEHHYDRNRMKMCTHLHRVLHTGNHLLFLYIMQRARLCYPLKQLFAHQSQPICQSPRNANSSSVAQ